MEKDYSASNILELYEDIILKNLNEENYPNISKLFLDLVNGDFPLNDFYSDFLILNIISLLEINSSMSPALALILKEAKLKIVRYTSMNLPEVKNNFNEIEDNYNLKLVNEVFSNKDGIEIKKRYLPHDNSFDLPQYPSTGTVIVFGQVQGSPNKEFKQTVEIDSKGRVLKLIGEPEIIDKLVNNESISYDDIYSSLLTQVLNSKEEKEKN